MSKRFPILMGCLQLLVAAGCAAAEPVGAPNQPPTPPAVDVGAVPLVATPGPTAADGGVGTPALNGSSPGTALGIPSTPPTLQPDGGASGTSAVSTQPPAPTAGLAQGVVPPIPVTYAVGKQWVYAYNFGGGPSTLTIGISDITGNNVTWDVTRQIGTSQPTSQNVTYTKDTLTPFSFMGASTAAPGEQVTNTNEAVTVPAGTFAATKTTVADSYITTGMQIDTTIVRWITPAVGLVKQTTTSTTTIPTAAGAASTSKPSVSTVDLSLQSYK